MSARKLLLVVAIGALAAALAPAASGASRTFNVSVRDDFFSPSTVSVRNGDRVIWRWSSANLDQHNVLSSGGAQNRVNSGDPRARRSPYSKKFTLTLAQRRSYFRTPVRKRKPFRVSYFCVVHAGMTGTVNITP